MKKPMVRELLVVLIGVLLGSAAMLGIFALLHKLETRVLLGALFGSALAILNFVFLMIGVSLAADKAEKQDVQGGKGALRTSMLLRYLILAVCLFAAAKSGYFHPVALVVPLLFVRPALDIGEFFRKSEEQTQ